jgi:copper transport protein
VQVTQALPAVALLAPDDGTRLVGALMAVDRLVVSTGLLVLLGGAGFVAVARLPTPAWRLTARLEGRAWWLLRVAWWATLIGTLAGLLLHGPFTVGVPLSQTLDATLLAQTFRMRFGGVWAVRVLLLLLLVAFLRAWSEREAAWTRTSAWVAVGVLAVALAATPALSGHSAAGPDAAFGAVVGVLHFSAAAVWFGGLVLLGTCMLPRADVGLLQAVPRFSSVAFTAMVVIVVTGILQSWRQLGGLQALGHTAYGRLLVAKVVAFLLLIAFAGRSRVLVRRKLTARASVGAAAPHQHAGGAADPPRRDDTDARSLGLLRRLVLAEVTIAIVVLAVTALLGIATPPTAT